jgi:hypothetical protein
MEMLAILARKGQITKERALDCGEKIHSANPAITAEVFRRFKKGLTTLGDGTFIA